MKPSSPIRRCILPGPESGVRAPPLRLQPYLRPCSTGEGGTTCSPECLPLVFVVASTCMAAGEVFDGLSALSLDFTLSSAVRFFPAGMTSRWTQAYMCTSCVLALWPSTRACAVGRRGQPSAKQEERALSSSDLARAPPLARFLLLEVQAHCFPRCITAKVELEVEKRNLQKTCY